MKIYYTNFAYFIYIERNLGLYEIVYGRRPKFIYKTGIIYNLFSLEEIKVYYRPKRQMDLALNMNKFNHSYYIIPFIH